MIFQAWSRGLLPAEEKFGIQSKVRREVILREVERQMLDQENILAIQLQMSVLPALQGNHQKLLGELIEDIQEHVRRVRREPATERRYSTGQLEEMKAGLQVLQDSGVNLLLREFSDREDAGR